MIREEFDKLKKIEISVDVSYNDWETKFRDLVESGEEFTWHFNPDRGDYIVSVHFVQSTGEE